jgi:hypothetical protein
MRMANDGNDEWATAGIVDGGGGVDVIGLIFFVGKAVTPRTRIVMVPVLLLVGIVRVHHLYLNPKKCKYQIFSNDIL